MFNHIKAKIKLLLRDRFSLFHVKNKNKYCGISFIDEVFLFVDVGANYGEFLPKVSRAMGFHVKNAILVEPDERCNDKLMVNARECGDNVTIVHKLISNHLGRAPFYLFDDPAQNSLLQGDFAGEAREVCEIDSVTGGSLLDEVRESARHRINILKVDVQGAEGEVLRSFGSDLELFKYIILEVTILNRYKDQDDFSDLLDLLKATHNYAGNLSEVYQENGHLDYMNAVFFRNE